MSDYNPNNPMPTPGPVGTAITLAVLAVCIVPAFMIHFGLGCLVLFIGYMVFNGWGFD